MVAFMHQKELQPQRQAHFAEFGVSAGALKVFFTQGAQLHDQLGAYGSELSQYLVGRHSGPFWPLRVVFCTIATEGRIGLGKNSLHPLQKNFVVAREMSKVFTG